MQYGIAIFPTEDAMHPAELGPAIEERGFESFWVAEHSHIPASRRTPFPGGGELPRMYYETMDPFVALTAAAITTTKLKVGTGICLVMQRDPIHTAKEVARLDVVSNGRFLFGIGAGWNEDEMENHGTDPKRRFKLLRERMEAMQQIWTEEPAEYHGELVDFDPMYAKPKPRQKPWPPIHVGGGYPGAVKRALRLGARGWIPVGRGGPDLLEQIEQGRKHVQQAGHSGPFEISIYGAGIDKDAIAGLRDAGVDRVVFFLPPDGKDKVLPVLDAGAELAAAIG